MYKFRPNSDLCLTGDLPQILPGVIAYGIQFDLNLYLWDTAPVLEQVINNLGERLPMETYTVVYDLESVQEGFIARCAANPMATAFGKTKDEAGDNLVAAIQEYLERAWAA